MMDNPRMKLRCQQGHYGGLDQCRHCGGLGYVLESRPACVRCERLGWFLPETMITSKEPLCTFDGIERVHSKEGIICQDCELRGNK